MRPYQAFQFPKSVSPPAPAPTPAFNVYASTEMYGIGADQASASFSMNADGSCGGFFDYSPGSWITPVGGSYGSSYWAKVDITSGSLTSGTTGSRVALTAGQTWVIETTGSGLVRSKSASGTIEIWNAAAAGTLVASGSFTMSALVDNT